MVDAKQIISSAAKAFGITADELVSKKRYRSCADAKAVVCYVLCTLQSYKLIDVGHMLHICHATVIYHNRRAGDWLRNPLINPDGAKAIKEIEKEYIN